MNNKVIGFKESKELPRSFVVEFIDDMGVKNEMTLHVAYQGKGNAYKGVMMDKVILPEILKRLKK